MANTSGEDFGGQTSYSFEGQIASIAADTYVTSSSSGVATITYYLMRGIALGVPVYWYATIIDTLAAEYTGTGPVTSITLIKRKQ